MYVQADSNGVKNATGQSFRLVHNGLEVIMLAEVTGVTSTKHELFTAATKAECEAEIARLELTVPEHIK
jgi:hypothetical protein